MRINSGAVSVIVVWWCAACNSGAELQNRDTAAMPADTSGASNYGDASRRSPGAAPAAPADTPPNVVRVAVPNEKADSIRLEGDWHPITLRLFKPASSILFLTYAPADMVAESVSSDEGEAHYFYANFGGKRNDEAFLLVFVLPPGTTEEQAVRRARAFKNSRTRPGYVVNTTLERHGDRFYYIAEHYPAEYGDGFGPRSHKIQEEWQWLD